MIRENIAKIYTEGRFFSVLSPNNKIMVVDDQPFSLLHAVDLVNYEGYEVIKTSDSNQAFSLAYQQQPDVILMDVVMPGINGLELSQKLKREPQTQSIPIVLMSVSQDYNILEQAIKIGVEDILLKPLEHMYLSCKLKSLVQQKRLNESLNKTQKVLMSIATEIENHCVDKNQQSFNLPNLVTSFAQYLGLSDDNIQDLELAAYFHDIGTINIPEEILTKKGKLSSAEQELIRQHVIIGEQICQLFHHRPNMLAIIRHHHEKYDGSGYPDCLKGEKIPYLAQIFQIVDIYHALTSKRPYKQAFSNQDSLAILDEETRKGWRNPHIFQQFKNFLETNQFDLS